MQLDLKNNLKRMPLEESFRICSCVIIHLHREYLINTVEENNRSTVEGSIAALPLYVSTAFIPREKSFEMIQYIDLAVIQSTKSKDISF